MHLFSLTGSFYFPIDLLQPLPGLSVCEVRALHNCALFKQEKHAPFCPGGREQPKVSPFSSVSRGQTNKEDIKNLQPGEGRKLPPLSCPQSLSSKVSGDSPWRLDKACPIVTLSMPTFSPPVPPNHLSATESKYRKGTQQRGRQGRALMGQGQAKTENRSNPMV